MPARDKGAPAVVQLRIALRGVEPEVWRRVIVPGAFPLSKLHDVIQAAMGWSNSHLHSFVIGDALFGAPDEDADPEQLDEGSVSVVEALYGHERFEYEYDFGDCWEHDVCVEFFRRSPLKLAVCLGGENACPPEDCGGPHGYATMLEALADPSHEDHKEFVEWIHEFEPTAFDLVDANVALQRLR